MTARPVDRLRPRLSRTLSAARWDEYRAFLASAIDSGYEVLTLEDWVDRGFSESRPTLLLRHDVDQHPAAALRMLAIEGELGVHASWYFRWRTAHPAVIGAVRASGATVGLHYESLTRLVLERGVPGPDVSAALLSEARRSLAAEIATFAARFGSIRSACPHGDTRVPDVRNATLLRGEDCRAYGIEFDGNDVMRGRGLSLWLTDRSAAEGRWSGEVTPADAFAARLSPVLCVVHPNNWASGPDLWRDRVVRAALPPASAATAWRAIRTGSDRPPHG